MKKPAFTLIELLIVITIIGILAVALLPSVVGAPGRARDAQRKADLKNIATALESYYSDNQKYPLSPDRKGICLDSIALASTLDFSGFDKYFSGNKIPQDPQGSNAKQVLSCAKGAYYYCDGRSNTGNYYLASYVETIENAWLTSYNADPCDDPVPTHSVKKFPLPIGAIKSDIDNNGGIPLYLLIR